MTVYDATHPYEIHDTVVDVDGDEYRADYVEVVCEKLIIHGWHTAVYGDAEWTGEIEWADGVDFEAPRDDDGIPTLQNLRIKVDDKKDLVLSKTLFESDTEFIATT